jgi:hypothetical protein
MANGFEQTLPIARTGRVPAAELARRRGVRPITSVDELVVPGLWESDEEYQAFLADLYTSRHSDLG